MPKKEPTEEEIKNLMDKAEKTASEGKKEPLPKTLKHKPDSGGTEKESDKNEISGPPSNTEEFIKEEPPGREEPEPKDSEREALKQEVKALKDDMANIKTLLQKAVEHGKEVRAQIEKGQSGEEEGAAGQDKAQGELTTEEELKMLQEAQAEEAAEGGDQSAGKGAEAPPSKTMMMFLLGKVLDNLGKVLPAALQSRAPAGGEGTSLSKLGEELLIAQIKSWIGGAALGGDNTISTQQLQTLGNIQGMMFNNFWNTVKNMPKPIAQQMVQTAIEGAGGTKEAIE